MTRAVVQNVPSLLNAKWNMPAPLLASLSQAQHGLWQVPQRFLIKQMWNIFLHWTKSTCVKFAFKRKLWKFETIRFWHRARPCLLLQRPFSACPGWPNRASPTRLPRHQLESLGISDTTCDYLWLMSWYSRSVWYAHRSPRSGCSFVDYQNSIVVGTVQI